ncbi:hypothetical protein WG908_09130 [Sphingobium sp. AN641]|uniref:hypothetical protein n=1 Tax=Sphingobium sp. AN641 TaxID=3133443 RepID=UPI0030C480FD
MRTSFRRSLALSLTTIVVLAGCSHRARDVAVAPPPAQPRIMPTPPSGAAPDMTVPAIGADGRRMTPNRGLSPVATLWHVRMALNVAALSCHDAADAARLQYNLFLKTHRTTLAKANGAVDGEFKARFAGAAIPQRERLNTTVYNFFALPPVQSAFCTRAIMVGGVVNGLSPADLIAYGPSALASLEQPFTDFYDAYAVYQRQMAQWRGGSQTLSQAEILPEPAATPAAMTAPVRLAMTLDTADLIAGDAVMAAQGGASRAFLGH